MRDVYVYARSMNIFWTFVTIVSGRVVYRCVFRVTDGYLRLVRGVHARSMFLARSRHDMYRVCANYRSLIMNMWPCVIYNHKWTCGMSMCVIIP